MSEKIKPETFKTPDEINELIFELEEDLGDNGAVVQSTLMPLPEEDSSKLVPDKYYRGDLFPQISSYLPDDMELTETEQTQLVKGIQRKLTGLSASVPIKCYGDACPFAMECPLHKIGKAPEGHSCPVESMTIDLYTKRYIDEFDVEPDNFSEVNTMAQLAVTHIMEMRGFMAIGKDEDNNSPDGIIKNVVGFTPEEDPITQYQEHPGYVIIDRAWKWRAKLLESLGATRREKYKMGGDNGDIIASMSEANASLRSKIDKLTTIDMSGD